MKNIFMWRYGEEKAVILRIKHNNQLIANAMGKKKLIMIKKKYCQQKRGQNLNGKKNTNILSE